MPAKLKLASEPIAKFIVFKREDFDAVMESLRIRVQNEPSTVDRGIDNVYADELDDAVVIRKKDLLAGPALHAYASAAQNALEILESRGISDTDLVAIRDHFQAEAQDADLTHAKRLPTL